MKFLLALVLFLIPSCMDMTGIYDPYPYSWDAHGFVIPDSGLDASVGKQDAPRFLDSPLAMDVKFDSTLDKGYSLDAGETCQNYLSIMFPSANIWALDVVPCVNSQRCALCYLFLAKTNYKIFGCTFSASITCCNRCTDL